MGFYHTIRVIQKTKSGLRAVTIGKRVSAYVEHGKAGDMARKAMLWPATVRVEIDEEDTQLCGYPANERTYQKCVIHKDGRKFNFYGKNGNLALLDEHFDARLHMHTLRIS